MDKQSENEHHPRMTFMSIGKMARTTTTWECGSSLQLGGISESYRLEDSKSRRTSSGS